MRPDSDPALMRQCLLDGLETGEHTAGNGDATAALLRFFCCAIVLSVRLLGILASWLSRWKLCFQRAKSRKARSSSTLQLTSGKDVTKSLTSLHFQKITFKMKSQAREDAINVKHTSTYDQHCITLLLLTYHLDCIPRCFTGHNHVAQHERGAFSNESRELLPSLQSFDKLRDLHIVYPVTRVLSTVLPLHSTLQTYLVRALPARLERTSSCRSVLSRQFLTDGEFDLDDSGTVHERDVEAKFKFLAERLRDVGVHEADVAASIVCLQ